MSRLGHPPSGQHIIRFSALVNTTEKITPSTFSKRVFGYVFVLGSQKSSLRTSPARWLTRSAFSCFARYPQFLHTFPDDPVLHFRRRRVAAGRPARPACGEF